MKFVYFLILINFIECIKVKEFCYKPRINNKLVNCHSMHSFECGSNLCSVDIKACQRIIIFSTMTLAKEGIHKERYKTFKSHIVNCTQPPPPKYKWSPNDVCMNTRDCKRPAYVKKWSTYRCKCGGRYSFNCNNNYCALNKHACQGLKSKPFEKIMKCKH
jgi:hypothetical protein